MKKDLPKANYTNPRGIPQAPFLEKIDEYCENEEDATHLLQLLQEQLQKYQFMEATQKERLKSLLEKVPDIQKSLEMVKFLQQQDKPFRTQYELNDTVYSAAEIQPVKTVMLWLGASTMLEYPLDEAIELLTSKLEGAHSSLDSCREDLEFLRENITTMEVNTARVINWRVAQRK